MRLHFNAPRSRSGMSLFETMVTLAILSLVLATTATVLRPPSPALRAKQEAARLLREANQLRMQAVQTGQAQTWDPEVARCSEGGVLTFYPDGTGRGPDLCLFDLKLTLHPLTGQMLEVPQ